MERRNKIVAGILAIFFGGLGIHAFYIGNIKMGVAIVIGTVIGFLTSIIGIGVVILSLIGLCTLAQGILYLIASENEFHKKYVIKQQWF